MTNYSAVEHLVRLTPLKLFGLCIIWAILVAGTTASTHSVPGVADLCPSLFDQAATAGQPGLPPAQLQLANWNIKKASEPHWQQDLAALAAEADLLLLQEAIPEEQLSGPVSGDWHFSFAVGYRQGELDTGVMTAAAAPPIAECHLRATEPLLRTPKATNISRFALENSAQTLLVINVHMVNFSLGMKAFNRQLDATLGIMQQHQGPVILAGDFNTWHQARRQALQALASEAGLTEVTFEQDLRSRFLGQQLDHVYVRGLIPVASATRAVDSSDHNPMMVTLSAELPTPGPS